ncbi:enoyl-CoA delta isomerase 2, mitochondrial [Cephus cinctus]|uniref:Enoyl-CoA delta isomerase 2, mitochondrial n=1 Tax=Cephus cinctus TaxID=211228 RepID=A0AAJ7CFW8_CEPCN|nr:enoyl-CoA delta isomerase 2, mitochondrial [Cephus cinctus]
MTSNVMRNVISEVNNGFQKITLNRPTKKNAITQEMYEEMTILLNESASNESIHMLVVTGAGDFYSSGNDMSSYSFFNETSLNSRLSNQVAAYKNFVDSLILYPKLLIALVNGPAIGIAATTLGLFDIVYASDKAYFHTPFSLLGLVAEGCSTYTFPKILGSSKAGEMLYLGYKLNAFEAKQRGFVSEIFQDDEINKVWSRLNGISRLSKESITATKRLVRKWDQSVLLNVNDNEAKEVLRRLDSPDFIEGITAFGRRNSKM